MTKTRKALFALLTILALVAAACGSSTDTATQGEAAGAEESEGSEESEEAGGGDGGDVRAAFVMVAPVGDAGWNFQHDLGRQGAEAATGIETAVSYTHLTLPTNREV